MSILIIFIIIILCYILFCNKQEHMTEYMTDLSNEAIQNIASVYNADNLSVSNIEVKTINGRDLGAELDVLNAKKANLDNLIGKISQIDNLIGKTAQIDNLIGKIASIDQLINNSDASRVKVIDTRNEDLTPTQYRQKGMGVYHEFKMRDGVGVRQTFVPWPDPSGGKVVQYYHKQGGLFVRWSNDSDNGWTNWKGTWGHDR